MKEGIENIYKYININNLTAATFFTTPLERRVKEVKEAPSAQWACFSAQPRTCRGSHTNKESENVRL